MTGSLSLEHSFPPLHLCVKPGPCHCTICSCKIPKIHQWERGKGQKEQNSIRRFTHSERKGLGGKRGDQMGESGLTLTSEALQQNIMLKEMWNQREEEQKKQKAWQLSRKGWCELRKWEKPCRAKEKCQEWGKVNGEMREWQQRESWRDGRWGGRGGRGRPLYGSKMFFVPVRVWLKIRICVTHLH